LEGVTDPVMVGLPIQGHCPKTFEFVNISTANDKMPISAILFVVDFFGFMVF